MEINRINLKKLADGVEGIPQEFFSMGDYRGVYTYEICEDTFLLKIGKIHECGSIGCPIGWAPFIFDRSVYIDYLLYNNSDSVFHYYEDKVLGINICMIEWDWCFHDNWEDIDNTPTGAAFRINYYLEHGIPTWFNDIEPSEQNEFDSNGWKQSISSKYIKFKVKYE